MTSEIQPRSQILRKRGPRNLLKKHVRQLLAATAPAAMNIRPTTWPWRACRYHAKQAIRVHLRTRSLWAPSRAAVCEGMSLKWGPRIGARIIVGPHLPQGPLWATPPNSAPPPACTHPVSARHAPGLGAHRPKLGAQIWRANNRRPTFAASATVVHTSQFSPATCVHALCGRPERARFGRAPSENGVQNWRANNCRPALDAGATVVHTPQFSPATCVHAPCGGPAGMGFAPAPAGIRGPKCRGS